jgi:hypothetical protein
LGILLVGGHADAGFDLSIPDNMVFTGFRLSYDKTLGLGAGVHASYWAVEWGEELPFPGIGRVPTIPSATLGAVWFPGITRQYIGLQGGFGAGLSGGIFAQQGKSGSFTGAYYEVWGAYILGGSVRQFMKWGQNHRETPLEWSLFGTYSVLRDGELRE